MEVPKICRNGHLDTEPCGICQQKRAETAEARVAVLREHMTGWLNSYGWHNGEYIDNLEEYFSEVLANLPTRAKASQRGFTVEE